MTDTYPTAQLLPGMDRGRVGSNRATSIIAVLALVLALGVPHLTSDNTGGTAQVQNSETSTVKLDGRGKWTGYM